MACRLFVPSFVIFCWNSKSSKTIQDITTQYHLAFLNQVLRFLIYNSFNKTDFRGASKVILSILAFIVAFLKRMQCEKKEDFGPFLSIPVQVAQ